MIKTNNKILYPELSYEIVGVLFDVFNHLGAGHSEKYYENAIAKGLKAKGIKYKRQFKIDLVYKDEKVGIFYLDFLIEGKIILELKTGRRFSKQHFDQVIDYLKASNKKLAILATFTFTGVNFIRLLNAKAKIEQKSATVRLTDLRKLFYY